MQKKILAIHTGGTISMSSAGGLVIENEKNPVSIGSAIDLSIILKERYPVKKPSPHITLNDILTVRDTILGEKDNFDGFVVTHGTDTLEETAYFLDLTLNLPHPVIVTGAMRSFDEIGSDALYNYISSLRAARDEKSYYRGVLVVFNDEIHTARNVTKTHTSNIATFQSPNHGPIGFLTKDAIQYHHQINPQDLFVKADIYCKVGLVKAHSDMDSMLFDAFLAAGYDGIVVEALGQGNIPPDALGGLQRILDRQLPVVLVSRAFNGIVGSYYDYEGGGYDLSERGVIFSNGLNGQKARIKLLLALSDGLGYDEIKEVFKH